MSRTSVRICALDFADHISDDNCREVVFICELWQGDRRIALDVATFVPDKHLSLADPALTVDVRPENEDGRDQRTRLACGRRYAMRYGYFDDESREYVITDPKTPVKWINYVGTLAFGGIVDHTGGALICKEDPALNRITKYIPQLPSSEFKGETLYLRFKQELSRKVLGAPSSGRLLQLHFASDAPGDGGWERLQRLSERSQQGNGYKVFSPFFVPTLDPHDLYECHVGLGYTRIVSEFYGIRTEVTVFVPLGDSRVVRDIQVTNVSDQPGRLTPSRWSNTHTPTH